MECRPGCAACCIVVSISSPIPGMPDGKPAGTRCVQLTANNLCRLFKKPDRPRVCRELRPEPLMCGYANSEAFMYLEKLEAQTKP